MSILKPGVIFILLSVIGASAPVYAGDEVICVNTVAHASNLQKMSQGDFSANAQWKEFTLSPTSIGYGPAADREYEMTVVDGKVILARPGDGDDIVIRNDPRPDEGVAMLQLASPERWGEVASLDSIGSFDDLGFELDQQVEDAGCGEDVLLPFRITGQAERVTWSMDTEPSRVVTSRSQPVVLVGLYNLSDKQTHFMVRGYNFHAHVMLVNNGQGGHLRDLTLAEGAKLYLPVQ